MLHITLAALVTSQSWQLFPASVSRLTQLAESCEAMWRERLQKYFIVLWTDLFSDLVVILAPLSFPSDTDYLKYLFPQFVKANLYHFCYTALGQMISICNYWNGETPGWLFSHRFWSRQISFFPAFLDFKIINEQFDIVFAFHLSADPHHRDLYVNSSDYLALLNSERPNPNSTGQKKNNQQQPLSKITQCNE